MGAATKAINAALWLRGADVDPVDAAPAEQVEAAPQVVAATLLPDAGPVATHRRIGRRALRAFRPLAAPLLNRLDHRMRHAIERSRVSEVVERLEVESANHARSFAAAADILNRLVEQLDMLSAAVGTIDLTVNTSAAQVNTSVAQVRDTIGGLKDYTVLLLRRNAIAFGRDMAVRTDSGYLLVPTEDAALVLTVFETQGRLEPGTLAVLPRLLRDGDFVIDVGASVGSFTVPAARRVGPSGRVLSLEPTPRVAELLRV